jgi:hypothetical protein
MVVEEGMIECRLVGYVHTVYDISIGALLIFLKIRDCSKIMRK